MSTQQFSLQYPYKEEMEKYVREVRKAVEDGLHFPEPPACLMGIRPHAYSNYQQWCAQEDRKIQAGPKLKILKCHACGAALTRRKCAYCGSSHVINQ